MLNLVLQRERSNKVCTPGEITIGGRHECWTLEDMIREVPGRPVKEWKIDKVTAIPAGRYRLSLYDSPKNKRTVALLHDVESYSYVEIHILNKASETDGCIGVGRSRPDDKTVIWESALAFEALMNKIRAEISKGGQAWLTVLNPGQAAPAQPVIAASPSVPTSTLQPSQLSTLQRVEIRKDQYMPGMEAWHRPEKPQPGFLASIIAALWPSKTRAEKLGASSKTS